VLHEPKQRISSVSLQVQQELYKTKKEQPSPIALFFITPTPASLFHSHPSIRYRPARAMPLAGV